MKKVKYLIEFICLIIFYGIFKIMPVDMASSLGGKLVRLIGPRLSMHKRITAHLTLAFPDKSEAEHKAIARNTWENIGRVVGEYPHLATIGKERCEIVGLDAFHKATKDKGQFILFSAHLANWEAIALGLFHSAGLEFSSVYRAPNNPYVAKWLDRYESTDGGLSALPKTRSGGMQLIRALRGGRSMAIMIDQKYNEGLPVPFFGHDAMTSPSFVELAQKYDLPLIPVQFERLEGARFRLTLHAPITTKGREPADVMHEANQMLEDWIRQHPEEWLWLHRRWPKETLAQFQNP